MNKYVVDKVVGEGSFGKALLCRRKADQRKCIIKQISLKKMSRKEAAQTEQESSLLARLKHPNIVTFWESFTETSKGVSYLWIAMDFADGGDLDHMIKARRGRLMPETQAMQLFVQIALAMKHVHDRKILHRDLKTQNIFLTKAGIVKLGDFGIARVLRNTGELASTQIGTPYYMSPEIMNNKRYNSKTDIWSLGCVLYELLTLKVPFEGNSMPQLVRNIVNGQHRPISTQYSQQARDLVKAMLLKDPKMRPGINSILSQPVVRNIISQFLNQGEHHDEFSHTVLHGEHILKKAPLPVDSVAPSPLQAAAAAAAAPFRQVSAVAPSAPSAPPPSAQVRAQPVPRPASREAVKNGEMDRLRAEAEKMRLKMDQITKERNSAVEAERKRLQALKEKERLEVHKMQMEKEARDKVRREEKAKKMKEYEKKKADDAARIIREAREAADRRREERSRPWAQPPMAKAKDRYPANGEGLSVAGAQAPRASPAWMNNAPARRPVAPSPSNAVREASPRNPPSGSKFGGDDDEQYMIKLRERLKAKDEEKRREKQAELSRLRERERKDRERREQERQNHARLEKERVRAQEMRAVEQKMLEKQKKEELEARLREERIAERRRQEDIRAEKEHLKQNAEEARLAEKKRIAAENMAVEKDRLRMEKDKLAKRLEERERDRQRREQDRQKRLNGENSSELSGARHRTDADSSTPTTRASKCGFDSDSSEETVRVGKVTPAPRVQQPSPAGNKKRGALKLDWLSNLEDEMGQLKGEMEKLSPHIRGGGPGNHSPHVGGGRGCTPSSGDGKGNLQFFKKNERPLVGDNVRTPPVSAASPRVPSREKSSAKPSVPAKSSVKSPKKPLKERSVSERGAPPASGLRGKKPVSMSVDDLAEIPPWKKKPMAGGRAVAKKHDTPPSMVGESSSVVSLDDRKEKREKDRADFKKFLSEKRHAKQQSPLGEDVIVKEAAQAVNRLAGPAPIPKYKKPVEKKLVNPSQPKPDWVFDLSDEKEVDVITLPDEKEVAVIPLPDETPPKQSAKKAADTPSPNLGLSITIENNNAAPDPPVKSNVKSASSEKKTAMDSAEKKQRVGLSKLISNIFGPKKKVIPGISPKVRLQSPKIKIVSPKLKAPSKSPKGKNTAKSPKYSTPAWMLRENNDAAAPADTANSVVDIAADPHAWSSEVMCGDYGDYNLATGPLPAGNNPAANSEYQELLDSMRLALDDTNGHNGLSHTSRKHHDGKLGGTHMDAIVEEGNDLESSQPNDGGIAEESVSDDETFEESSVSLSASESEDEDENEENSDWSVDNGSDFDEQEATDVVKEPVAKPLAHFVNKSKDSKIGSRNLNSDFSMESEAEGAPTKDRSAELKNTLYGVPISLSTSMKKDMSNLASYGPSVRIETLRIVLEDRLGERPFINAYKYLKKVKDRVPLENEEEEEEAEEEKLLEDMEGILGTNGLRYLDLLYELLTAEENF